MFFKFFEKVKMDIDLSLQFFGAGLAQSSNRILSKLLLLGASILSLSAIHLYLPHIIIPQIPAFSPVTISLFSIT